MAAGPFAHMSLGLEKDALPWFCCQIPGICTFSMIAVLCYTAAWHATMFVCLAAALSLYIAGWSVNMSIFSVVGAWRMRRDSCKDWHAELVKLSGQDADCTDTAHFVILPTYKEDETLLKETLENLARSPMAKSCLRVVLGMELREGPDVMEKAKRIIADKSDLFAGMSATFHPSNLPGEVPGKSSNVQWAFRKVKQEYDIQFRKQLDTSRVFVTVIDADSILHPQYFSNLSYQAMTMSREARVWRMWQAPVLLLRNFFSVPGVTRVSGLGTVLFELAGLANQYMGSHITFSSYSMTLALAAHRIVNGWDPDVIGEDHHMFVKCYFAPLWEAALEPNPPLLPPKPILPKVQLDPIYLPVFCYMAESTEQTYWKSVAVRFQQARRHSQGVAELSYCFLQYIRLCMTVGFSTLPFVAHRGILCIIWKMFTVHIINCVQATSVVLGVLVTIPKFTTWALDGGLSAAFAGGQGFFASMGASDIVWYAVVSVFGSAGPVFMLAGITTFIVLRDSLDGTYDKGQAHLILSNPAKPCLSFWQKLSLVTQVQWDMSTLTEPTVFLYGMIPELMAAWSLVWRGTAFEYVVAPKPLTQGESE